MFDKLQSVEERYEKLNELLSDPEVVSDSDKLREYSKEQSSIAETVEVYREYKTAQEEYQDAKDMLDDKLDDDMREMVKEEVNELQERLGSLEERTIENPSYSKRSKYDDKNVIMEIRGAAGGDEAALFAGDLYRMYSRYAEAQGWKTDVIEQRRKAGKRT